MSKLISLGDVTIRTKDIIAIGQNSESAETGTQRVNFRFSTYDKSRIVCIVLASVNDDREGTKVLLKEESIRVRNLIEEFVLNEEIIRISRIEDYISKPFLEMQNKGKVKIFLDIQNRYNDTLS